MASGSALLLVGVVVPVSLWVSLGALLWRVRRRGRLPAGAVRVFLLGGVAANIYPVAVVSGVPLPRWMLVPGLVVAIAAGYGYTRGQVRRARVAAGLRWDGETARRPAAGRGRVLVARLNETQTDRAGVDASGADETEAR